MAIKQKDNIMANEFDSVTLEAILAPQTQALQALAMRPQKTSATTTTTTTTTPYALDNMIANRDRIGQATQELDDILKARESFKYRFGQGLANVTPQNESGAGWLSGFLRGVGGGLTGYVDNRAARAQQKYENEMKDLAEILAFDKAMGDVQTQVQKQVMGYTPMEYGTSGGKGTTGKGAGAGSLSGVQQSNFGRSVGYDPVENLPDFGPVTRAALSEDQLGVMKYLPYAQSAAKGLTDKTATQLQSTWSDISDNILSGRVLDFVGKAGGVRVADTPAEQEFIFGPIRNYQNMSKRQLQAGLKQARNNFVASGMNKVAEANQLREQQGLPKLEITEDELKTWWNSAFSVPEGKQTEKMYNVQNPPAVKTKEPTSISVGEIRNGYRFKGGDPKKKENWEAI